MTIPVAQYAPCNIQPTNQAWTLISIDLQGYWLLKSLVSGVERAGKRKLYSDCIMKPYSPYYTHPIGSAHDASASGHHRQHVKHI